MSETTHNTRLSLLGLPRELRLQIYEIVVQFPVNHSAETLMNPRKRPLVAPKLELPIQSLALSCRFIAREVQSLTRSLPLDQRFAIATIEVCPYMHSAFHIRRAPCPVVELKMLKVEVFYPARTSYPFAGAPSPSKTNISPELLGWYVSHKLKYLLSYRSLLGKASALEKIEVNIRFLPRGYDKAMQLAKASVEWKETRDALSLSTAVVLSIRYSIDE